jgi:hypothetical protein
MAGLNLFTNNAATTLASGINSSVTSLTVATATGALFPTLAGSQYFYCTLANTGGTVEIVKVTARSTDTFTIVRGQDGTSAVSWSAGDKVELRLTRIDLLNFPQLDSTNTFADAQTFSGAVSYSTTLTGGTGIVNLGSGQFYKDASGNVGIGTTSPASYAPFTVRKYITSGAQNYAASFSDAVNATLSIGFTSGFANYVCDNGQAFYTSNTERMRIDSTGNILIAQAARATITTDNDLSFDMNVASNFKCTPTAGGALTFTNITSGQSGWVLLVNGSNYAITAAATTKLFSGTLTTISTTGTYLLSYFSDGTNVYVTASGALT